MSITILKQAKVLVVDDEKPNIRFLEIILQQAGYTNVYSTTDARDALHLFHEIRPDIILLDLMMPHLDGFAVLEQLQTELSRDPVPILVLTADATLATKHTALKAGAKDFLTKPLDAVEVLLRIDNLLEFRFHSVLLEERVRERTHDLEEAQLETLRCLALAAEYRDDNTGLHTARVGRIAGRIAEALGLTQKQVDLIVRTAPLHDVGKIGIADAILLKPGKLTPEEFAIMKQHTTIGGSILSASGSSLLQSAKEIALTHHEHWNGKGYPAGLQGEEIPLSGRIVAVADVFDALTHQRPYKEAWSVEEAVTTIKCQGGRQFDPCVVKAFLTQFTRCPFGMPCSSDISL